MMNTQNTTTNFRACPFCGDRFIQMHTREQKYTIGCNTLNCVCLHTEGKLFNTSFEATKAWNRRVGETDEDTIL